ncbi:hypothetical protein [Cedecea sp. NFIX57]|uniref:hypothetical protein n=1 Tax=Cedecea sp. NFIX57 TaxID=1566286 RepID=UPI000A0E5418|nr:hypothetical protein [Cedecea sp. NFIX57]SMG62037.1 hypothetical protein SAMN03159353_11054 [Cedecea sp. NFIX57]
MSSVDNKISKGFFKQYTPDGELSARVKVIDSTFLVFTDISSEKEMLRLDLVKLIQCELNKIRRNALGLESWQKAAFAEAIHEAIQNKADQLGVRNIKAD